MKKIGVLDRDELDALREKHGGHRLFATHIEPVLTKAHCYRVNLFAQDCYRIWVCSLLPTAQKNYQPISEAVEYIKSHQAFLTESANWNSIEGRHYGRLSGVKVQEYLIKLNACQPRLQDCFMKMGDCFVLDVTDKRRNEVMDGMHRLVAYGLVTELKDDHFPISIYFGTDKTLQPDEKDNMQ